MSFAADRFLAELEDNSAGCFNLYSGTVSTWQVQCQSEESAASLRQARLVQLSGCAEAFEPHPRLIELGEQSREPYCQAALICHKRAEAQAFLR